jgi:hypothetical protein
MIARWLSFFPAGAVRWRRPFVDRDRKESEKLFPGNSVPRKKIKKKKKQKKKKKKKAMVGSCSFLPCSGLDKIFLD